MGFEVTALGCGEAFDERYTNMFLLARMWEDGRRKPLVILSRAPLLDQLRGLMDRAYPGLAARIGYPVEYREAASGTPFEWEGLRFTLAPTQHSVTNLAVRLESRAGKFCYSGDGQFTDESRALFAGANLLVHEAYSFNPSPIHGDLAGVIQMAAYVS